MQSSTKTHSADAILFALDVAAIDLAETVLRLIGVDAAASNGSGPLPAVIFRINSTGEALRLVHQIQPKVPCVCIGQESLIQSTALISALHQRVPNLPLVAITGEHNLDIERAVRTAGAGCYFALDSDDERRLLGKTLESFGVGAVILNTHSGPAPPARQLRAAPPSRDAPSASRPRVSNRLS